MKRDEQRLTVTVKPGCTREQRDELADKIGGAAREVLGDVRVEVTADPPQDAKARREAAMLAASWSGC
ncbi:hypothetical protein [Nonomuraea typhae]|uniref:Uncharacterized protein n=1 Tax=Nonomuraea typhae TaxID=2603600 RepID=A0ABW7YLH9_9ACTN|nr:hypothetical protein [Nonomuraea typhae]